MQSGPVDRETIEQVLKSVVMVLRKELGEGNLVLRVPGTGDLVAILPVDEQQAEDLQTLLGRAR